jgi:hypothetical protein
VAAAHLFHPSAEATNPTACGFVEPAPNASEAVNQESERQRAALQDRMDLHRTVWRGKAFHGWMEKPPVSGLDKLSLEMSRLEAGSSSQLRPLPVTNFLDINNDLANAIVQQALPGDQERFRAYLSHRPLGIGMITGVSLTVILLLSS